MTTKLSPPSRSAVRPGDDRRRHRPLALTALSGGVAAALATLLVCLSLGVVGWFLTDAGAHGTSRDGLRVGALGWLTAHGSGLTLQGVQITVMPLAVTALAAWAAWRMGHRVGDAVSGHGPDADRIADGERDWTVPVAVVLFATGYALVVVVTALLAASDEVGLSVGRALGWALLLTLLLGGPAIAVGSGRAAIWAAGVPESVGATLAACARILGGFLSVSFVLLLGALLVDLSEAANVYERLHADAGDATTITALGALLLPNATVFSGSYLLGPGFLVGAQTLVSPGLVVLGPLPLFPLLAALPDDGETSALTASLVALPPLVAAIAVMRNQRRHPTYRWEQGALRGGAAGVLAGLCFGVLAGVAGGAVGPGRMRLVEPLAFEVLVHAVPAFGLGGLVGGLAITWWQRRSAPIASSA
ncbi:cell division protein PerM [Nocardioides pacificus]